MMADDIFTTRREHTQALVERLQATLKRELADRYDELVGDHTCVYATGSCGRGEMGEGSDLDAYAVRVEGEPGDSTPIEDAVRAANAAAGLPELDGDGKYLEMVDARLILDRLGAPNDDGEGVFTKRILLMLESRVLVGAPAYERLLDRVLDAYWKNETQHRSNYLPLVLVNDIVRYWRIVLLNHESRLRDKEIKLHARPGLDEAQIEAAILAERRYSSYKLRLPRCMSCFSALTYLLALTPTDPAHVSRAQVREMIALQPVQRLNRLPELVGRELALVDELLSVYASYLEQSNAGKAVLIDEMQRDVEVRRRMFREGDAFTKLMFDLVQELGGGRPLHRHMVV